MCLAVTIHMKDSLRVEMMGRIKSRWKLVLDLGY